MSTLQFPTLQIGAAPIELCTLDRVDEREGDLQLVISDTELVHRGDSSIYRAVIHCEGEDETGDVICKVVSGEEAMSRLRKEAQFYSNQLRNLQLDILPLLYGLFEGELAGTPAGCLVIGYCGEPLREPLSGMSCEFKYEVISALGEIHSAGVVHNDFGNHNIVVDDYGKPYIIDFGHAEAHECGQALDIVFHAEEPSPRDFGCDEMHDACRQVELWRPRYIHYFQALYRGDIAKHPQDLAKQAPKEVSPDVALLEAYKVINHYYTWLRKKDSCDWNRI